MDAVLAIFLTCLVVANPSQGAFSPPQPIPFHASPIFLKAQQTREKEPAATLPFFLPVPQQDKPNYYGGFVPIRTLGGPPPLAAPLPWENSGYSTINPTTRPHNLPEAHSIPRAQSSKKIKPLKGGTGYPKKWVAAPPEGKKTKQKNIEKHRKQILVASSMTTKDLRSEDQEAGQEHIDILRKFQKPKNKRAQVPLAYKPSPVQETHPLQVPSHLEIPVEAVAFTESHQKPYAHNHQQEASGTGFTPLFAAEAAGTHLSSAAGFGGHEGIHQIGDGSGDRIHFHIHGEKGPKSYRFGYDTGKGPDRQFRYEQRDDHGNVKGHFGFYDKHGKLQVAHYSADPKNGFSTDGGNFGKHSVL